MFATIEEILQDFAQGKMVILLDNEDRENEGDLLCAADFISHEKINFMAKHARGLICLTLDEKRCKQLNLSLMVQQNTESQETNFTVSVDAARGINTGISAADRATTILTATAKHACEDDLVQPGHIFPLLSRKGGVLTRAGHTEAGCDLARICGLTEAAVIVEIMNEDGTMARRDDLKVFAKTHGLKIGTISDLIAYRLAHDSGIEIMQSFDYPYASQTLKLLSLFDRITKTTHLAIVKGDLKGCNQDQEPIATRVHVQNFLEDALGLSTRAKRSFWTLQRSLNYIAKQKAGVVVVLRNENSEQINKILENLNNKQVSHFGDDKKTYGVGARILHTLGVKKMKLMSSGGSFDGLQGFGLHTVSFLEKDHEEAAKNT